MPKNKSSNARNERTSPRVASLAGAWRKDRAALLAIIKRVDSIVGSALTQAPNKPKRKAGK
jgi:hypothetical protein